jgi:protease II
MHDGRRVPISLVYRIDKRREGPQPLLLYGYGAYGYSLDVDFSSTRLSLLDSRRDLRVRARARRRRNGQALA